VCRFDEITCGACSIKRFAAVEKDVSAIILLLGEVIRSTGLKGIEGGKGGA